MITFAIIYMLYFHINWMVYGCLATNTTKTKNALSLKAEVSHQRLLFALTS